MEGNASNDYGSKHFPLIVVNSKGNVQRYNVVDPVPSDDRGAFVPYSAYEVEVMNNIAQVARLNKRIEDLQASASLLNVRHRETLEIQIAQTNHWHTKYENSVRDHLDTYEAPPKTVLVKTDGLPIEFECMDRMTDTYRNVREDVYRKHDGRKRAVVVLESK